MVSQNPKIEPIVNNIIISMNEKNILDINFKYFAYYVLYKFGYFSTYIDNLLGLSAVRWWLVEISIKNKKENVTMIFDIEESCMKS